MDYVPWGSAPDTEFEKQDDNEFLLGEFVWTGFDYLGKPAPDTAKVRHPASSYFGIVGSGRVKKRQILFIPKPMEQQTGFTCYASLDMA